MYFAARSIARVIVSTAGASRSEGGLLGFPGSGPTLGRNGDAFSKRAIHLLEAAAGVAIQAPGEQRDEQTPEALPLNEPGTHRPERLDLKDVLAVEEAREAERDRDRVQVDFSPEVRRGDDVLDLDHRVLLDRDAGRLDLFRDHVDRGLDVLEALRPRADDLPAPEQERRGLRLLQSVDESGELLRLIFGPAEGEGDRLEVELLPEGGGGDDVLNLDFGQSYTTIP